MTPAQRATLDASHAAYMRTQQTYAKDFSYESYDAVEFDGEIDEKKAECFDTYDVVIEIDIPLRTQEEDDMDEMLRVCGADVVAEMTAMPITEDDMEQWV